ncbi:MAG: RIO1 family regulatory kinase/ATPase [Candidatus Bathyarchaeia archaeon]
MQIAERFRSLAREDFRILAVTELLMKHYEYVPVEEILRFSRLRDDEVLYRLRNLSRDRLLVSSTKTLPTGRGYVLTTLGYDALALRALVDRGKLEAIGKPLGVGKESDIYEALDSRGKRCAVKFHRLGRTSFRQTMRKRGYTVGRTHISWLYQSRLSAEKEYTALKTLYKAGVSVPRPIGHNRHTIVMGVIEGTELKFAEMEDPKAIMLEILRNVRVAYLRGGLVHSDLSGYNVLVKADGKVLIIDWPQSVSVDHPNAMENLRRDVCNIIDCFERKAGISLCEEAALEYVTGKRGTIAVQSFSLKPHT